MNHSASLHRSNQNNMQLPWKKEKCRIARQVKHLSPSTKNYEEKTHQKTERAIESTTYQLWAQMLAAAGQEGVTPIWPPSEQKGCYGKISEVGTVSQQETVLEEFMTTLLGLYYYNYYFVFVVNVVGGVARENYRGKLKRY